MIDIGDTTPLFSGHTDVNPNFAFGSVGGRWVLLQFFGSLADPAARAAHEVVFANRGVFDDINACYFGVSADPEDRSERGVKADIPGLRYFYDDSRDISRLYGLGDAVVGFKPVNVLLDRALRVVAITPLEDTHALLVSMFNYVKAEAQEPAVMMAPVLTVPRVFEPELCQALIDYYQRIGGKASGVMREIDGMTVGVMDDGMKKRRDVRLDDIALQSLTRARIGRRLIPQITRAFNWRATRIERFMIACYQGEDGGFFNAHRDNTTAGTAHRRFAVSLNLNSDYDGGELVFPEYGRRTYRPPPGGATVFGCSLLHAATPVTRGTRYVFVPFLYDEEGARIREANMSKLAGRQAPKEPESATEPEAEPQPAE